MKHELSLAGDFGPQLADGEAASRYRMTHIEPYLDLCEKVVLDFTGVRSANSSFVNALVSGVIEQHGRSVLPKLAFKGCNPVIRVLVEAAVSLGLRKVEGRVDA